MTLQLSRRHEFAVVTLYRPAVLNALSYETLRRLDDVLDEVQASDARALLITGAGEKAFCAGADIAELGARSVGQRYEGTWLGQRTFARIEQLSIPSVALVNGYALGGGCELALACTFRLASVNAKFGLPEIKLGLVPGYGGTQRLPRLVGLSRGLEILMSGRTVEAGEAVRIGLVNEVVEGDLLAAGMRFARAFSHHSLLALRLVRDSALRGMEQTLSEGLRTEADLSTVSMLSEDGQEGVRAFVGKRPAVFKDR